MFLAHTHTHMLNKNEHANRSFFAKAAAQVLIENIVVLSFSHTPPSSIAEVVVNAIWLRPQRGPQSNHALNMMILHVYYG